MSEHHTHAYVATLGCGCGVGLAMDDGHWKDDVERWQDEGYAVARLPLAEAQARFFAHCQRYPHTPWQKRAEAGRKAQEPTLW